MENEKFNWQYKHYTMMGQCWSSGQSDRLLILIHGMGEHSGRYPYLVQALTKAGYLVYSFDHVGHGMSSGKRGHVDAYTDLLDSTSTFFELVMARHDMPVHLFAHSMGGNVGANFLLRKNYQVEKTVLSAPWLKLPKQPPGWQVALGKFMLKVKPDYLDQTRLNAELISRDGKEVAAYKSDPLVHGWISPAFYFGVSEAGIYALDHAAKLAGKRKLLVYQGSADQITSIPANSAFANSARADYKLWDNYYHELHNDYGKEKVFEHIINWLGA